MQRDTGEHPTTLERDFTAGKHSKCCQLKNKQKGAAEVKSEPTFNSYRHTCDFSVTLLQMVFQSSFLEVVTSNFSLLNSFQNNA